MSNHFDRLASNEKNDGKQSLSRHRIFSFYFHTSLDVFH